MQYGDNAEVSQGTTILQFIHPAGRTLTRHLVANQHFGDGAEVLWLKHALNGGQLSIHLL
jgi:hypothetical protein